MLTQELPAAIEEALQRSPIATSLVRCFAERTFDDGAPVTAIGPARMEQAPANLPGAGLRDLPVVRTLSAADEVLELQIATSWFVGQQRIVRSR